MTADVRPNRPASVFVSLNERFQRMMGYRESEAGEGGLSPEFLAEEAELCEALLPLLLPMARGREEWATGALYVLCDRWRRGVVRFLSGPYLSLCVAEAGRLEGAGVVPLFSGDAATRADATPEPCDDLVRQAEALEAGQRLSRLCAELVRFVETLDEPELRHLARAMLAASDLRWGFGSRYALEAGVTSSTVTRRQGKLDALLARHLQAVEGLGPPVLGLSAVILLLREQFPEGIPGLDAVPLSSHTGGEMA